CLPRARDWSESKIKREPGRSLGQRALPPNPRREQTNLFGANFLFAGRSVRKTPPERCLFPSRFRSATLSLVAGRFSRSDGPAALGMGQSIDLRQPRVERFCRADAPGRNRATGSETAN